MVACLEATDGDSHSITRCLFGLLILRSDMRILSRHFAHRQAAILEKGRGIHGDPLEKKAMVKHPNHWYQMDS